MLLYQFTFLMNYRCVYAQHHLFIELIFAKGTGKNSTKSSLDFNGFGWLQSGIG
jgi:hypothetical protein